MAMEDYQTLCVIRGYSPSYRSKLGTPLPGNNCPTASSVARTTFFWVVGGYALGHYGTDIGTVRVAYLL